VITFNRNMLEHLCTHTSWLTSSRLGSSITFQSGKKKEVRMYFCVNHFSLRQHLLSMALGRNGTSCALSS
jgi:hypothetical protein